MVSEDQLLEREEAIRGDDAEHLKEMDGRGDTALSVDDLPEEDGQVSSTADYILSVIWGFLADIPPEKQTLMPSRTQESLSFESTFRYLWPGSTSRAQAKLSAVHIRFLTWMHFCPLYSVPLLSIRMHAGQWSQQHERQHPYERIQQWAADGGSRL